MRSRKPKRSWRSLWWREVAARDIECLWALDSAALVVFVVLGSWPKSISLMPGMSSPTMASLRSPASPAHAAVPVSRTLP